MKSIVKYILATLAFAVLVFLFAWQIISCSERLSKKIDEWGKQKMVKQEIGYKNNE